MEISLSIKIKGLKKIKKVLKLDGIADGIAKALAMLGAGIDPKTMIPEDLVKAFKGQI